jgi:hypothetical protein
MGKATQTYGEAMEAARGLLAASRLADPLEHFPYKHDDVCALVDENPPMGPEGADDDRFRAEDYTSRAIADATRDYIAAQAAYLEDPGDAAKAEYERTRDVLQAARLDHRSNRRGVTVGGVMRAPRAGE